MENQKVEVRKETTYFCPVCGMEYRTKEEAVKCMGDHVFPTEVVQNRFGSNHSLGTSKYPSSILIKMGDGTLHLYKRAGKGQLLNAAYSKNPLMKAEEAQK